MTLLADLDEFVRDYGPHDPLYAFQRERMP